MFKRFADLIAQGQNPQFVGFMAHSAVAFILVEHLPHAPRWTWALAVSVYAAVKEFWFDARYEHDPPQTWRDNLQDFAGYVTGAWLAVWPAASSAC